MKRWLLYGAYGYTGQLIIEEAVKRGHKPVLAGRNAAKLSPLAEKYGLEWLAVELDDEAALTKAMAGIDLVFHAAGPFIHTSDPMIRACLTGGVHYLDITGEIAVFENTFRYDEQAKEKGVTLISGAGFDIIPTDCLAKYVADQLAGAVDLEIAISVLNRASAGTMKTMLEMLPGGGWVRRNGRLIRHRLGTGGKQVRFCNGKSRHVIPVPWGDLATGQRSTGVANITAYMAFPPVPGMSFTSAIGGAFLSIGPVQRLAQAIVDKMVKGPDEQMRHTNRSYIWARAADAEGNEVEAWLETGEAYRFTAVAGVRCIEKLLTGDIPTGALTPSLAFGADFVLEIEGSRRYDKS